MKAHREQAPYRQDPLQVMSPRELQLLFVALHLLIKNGHLEPHEAVGEFWNEVREKEIQKLRMATLSPTSDAGLTSAIHRLQEIEG